MCAEGVVSVNEVSINSVRYPIKGSVQRALSSNYPEKLVTGDYTKDSSPILSTLSLTDHRGGIGLDVMEGQGDTDRSWYSTADIRWKGHLILPPLVTNTGNLPAGLSNIFHLLVYQGDVYANVDATTNGVYKYTPGGDTWGLNLLNNSLLNNSGRWTTADINSKSYIVFGGGGHTYVHFDGTTWAEETVGAIGGFMASWDDRLWVASLGSPYYLMYTLAPAGSWVVLSPTPILRPAVKAGRLFVGRTVGGDETLYLALPTGLYAYDVDNDKWHETGLQIPDNAGVSGSNFASGVVWRDDIYFGTRSAIFKYSISGEQATIESIGPDRDYGLPSGKGYLVMDMVASLNDLIVSLKGTTSVIMAYDGRGWRVLYEGGGANEELWPLLVAGTAGDYKLWFANNTTSPYNISWLPLPSDIINPIQLATYTHAAAATHDWPWFTAGQSEVTKVAMRVKVETLNPTTSETVKVYYAVNQSATFQIMTNATYTDGIITAAGIHTFNFPSVDSWVSTTALVGTEFRSIRFRVVFANSTNTNTPDVLGLTLEYYKKLDPKYQFQVTLDLNQEYKGNTPKALRAALLAAQETTTLVEFTYRDPVSNTDATFYVQVRPQVSSEETGFDERGQSQLLLVEV